MHLYLPFIYDQSKRRWSYHTLWSLLLAASSTMQSSLADGDPACNWKMRRDQDELSCQPSDRATSGFDSQKRWSGLTDTSTSWSLDWAWRVPALYGWRRRRRSRHWTWLSSALPNIHILAANKVKIISFQHPPSHATHNTPASGRDEEILKNQRVIISNQLTL